MLLEVQIPTGPSFLMKPVSRDTTIRLTSQKELKEKYTIRFFMFASEFQTWMFSFVWKIFVLIGRLGVPIIFKDFGLSLQTPSGSPNTNFWLLFTFEVLNILLFEIIFISIG
jgi:hypothetical protein